MALCYSRVKPGGVNSILFRPAVPGPRRICMREWEKMRVRCCRMSCTNANEIRQREGGKGRNKLVH